MLAMPPVLFSDHVAFPSAQTSRGSEKSLVASPVFVVSIVLEFQGLIGVLFTIDQLPDARETEFLESERIFIDVSIEGILQHIATINLLGTWPWNGLLHSK